MNTLPENHKQPKRGFKQLACEILDISTRSYSNFSKQKRLIITLLEKYFTKEDLEEFLEKKEISKFETKMTNKEIKAVLQEVSETPNDLSKYFIALQSIASATNKEDELLTDIKDLIKKHIQ